MGSGPRVAGFAVWRFHLRAGVRLAWRVVLPPVVAALGAAYLPWLARPLALAGAMASCAPDWPLLAAGGVLVVAGDLAAGGLPRRAPRRADGGLPQGARRPLAVATPVDGFREAPPPVLPATTVGKADQRPGEAQPPSPNRLPGAGLALLDRLARGIDG
jgi:hypothetical protein